MTENVKLTARNQYSRKLSNFFISDKATHEVVTRIADLIFQYRPKIVLGYTAFKKEVDLASLYDSLEKQGIVLAFPRYDSVTAEYSMVMVQSWREQMVRAHYDIAEPLKDLPVVDLVKIGDSAVWLVPGVAFSPIGVRLGRGKGYYDRLLENQKGLKIGIAWSCQIVSQLIPEPHDILMDKVVTEQEVIHCPMG